MFDNLVVGFALGTFQVEFVVAGAVITVISIAMSLIGLEIGGRVGVKMEQRSELIGGVVLMVVGLALGTGVLG